MFSYLANIYEEMQISGKLKFHFEMTLRKISGCSFHGCGDSAPWGLCLLVLTPISLLLETETSWQKQESHGTWQRKTCGSHMTNSIGHTVPAWNIFSLKLVKIWSDKVTQRLRSWEQHSLAIWELRQSYPQHVQISEKAWFDLGKTLNNTQETQGPEMDWTQISEAQSSNVAARTSYFPHPLSAGCVMWSWAFYGWQGWLVAQHGRNPSSRIPPSTFSAPHCLKLSRVKPACSWGKTSSRTEISAASRQELSLDVVQIEQCGLYAEVLYKNKGAPVGHHTALQTHSCCKTLFTGFLPHAEFCRAKSQREKKGLYFKLSERDMEM